ncbi:Sec-independent protein translocase subunit TatA [Streptomyces sp. NPDC048279]|jgi:sec-independent protein translocase protein TatA|uniref:Sec-independent protein translocase subunit TatA n=1 Tax=Streptomyces sp. NPDC048279 TaxID=3154714 RepID=UPI003430B441
MLRNGLEPWHLLVVAIVFIVLFGSRKLPDTARALGKSMRILRSEAKAMRADDPAAPVAPTSVQMAAEPTAAPVQPEAGKTAEPTVAAG